MRVKLLLYYVFFLVRDFVVATFPMWTPPSSSSRHRK